MTKEEIYNQEVAFAGKAGSFDIRQNVYRAMTEYAQSQTSSLLKQIEEKDREIERLESVIENINYLKNKAC